MANQHPPIELTTTAVILAGGESLRMGRDKSLLPVDGQPMLSRVINALRPLSLPILLITNTPAAHAPFHLPMIGDARAGLGAIGGLHTALTHITTDNALIVACDMPRLSPTLLAYLVNLAAEHSDADAIVPRLGGRTHPLHAVYRRRTLPVVESQIDSGKLALNALLDSLTVRWVEESELRQHNPSLDSFINLNTPQDVSDLPSPFA